MDPLAPKPSIADSARQFGVSPRRIKKIIYKARTKIEAAKRAADEKEQAPSMLKAFVTKRTGGVTYQHNGQFWNAEELIRASTYSTSINSAATAASSRDIKQDD
jgi:hypothetical protein